MGIISLKYALIENEIAIQNLSQICICLTDIFKTIV